MDGRDVVGNGGLGVKVDRNQFLRKGAARRIIPSATYCPAVPLLPSHFSEAFPPSHGPSFQVPGKVSQGTNSGTKELMCVIGHVCLRLHLSFRGPAVSLLGGLEACPTRTSTQPLDMDPHQVLPAPDVPRCYSSLILTCGRSWLATPIALFSTTGTKKLLSTTVGKTCHHGCQYGIFFVGSKFKVSHIAIYSRIIWIVICYLIGSVWSWTCS